jgi:transcriptional regulator with XRE-family HTH domain
MAQPDIVGRHVRQLRLARKLTQMELAEQARIPQSTLSDIERGTRDGAGITLRAARRLAFALGVSLDALAGTPLDDTDGAYEPADGALAVPA